MKLNSLKAFLASGVLLCALHSSERTAAQDIELRFGNPMKIERQMSIRLIGGDKENYYLLKTKAKGVFGNNASFYLERYDANYNLNKLTELKMPDNKGNKMSFEGLAYMNGQLNLFTSYYNKTNKQNYSFVNTISDKGLVNNDYREIDHIDAEKKNNDGSFRYRFSNDSSKILVLHHTPYKKGNNEVFACSVYDSKFNKIWDKIIELPVKDEKFSFSDYTVDNEGRVYILGSLELKKERKKPGNLHSIYSYDHITGNFRQFDVDIAKFINDISFRVNNRGDLICLGFYSDEKGKSSNGVFVININGRTQEINHKNIQPFDKELTASLTSHSKANKNKGLPAFSIDHIILKEDGGVIFLAEQYYVVVVTSRGQNGASTTTYFYHYNDIIAFSVNPDASIAWSNFIPKKQVSRNDGGPFSSYAMSIYKDKIYLFYNDHKNNVDLKDSRKRKIMNRPNKSISMMSTLDGNGHVKTQVLFDSAKEKMVLRPKLSNQAGDNRLMVVSYSTGSSTQMKLGSIHFR
jgi:hypothetical protein